MLRRLVAVPGICRSLPTKGVSMWVSTSLEQLQAAETALLTNIKNKLVYDTHVGDGLFIHTLEAGEYNKSGKIEKAPHPDSHTRTGSIENTHSGSKGGASTTSTSTSTSSVPLVLTHGYGMGLAAFHQNLPVLSRRVKVYATDWLGYGLSSRPPWTAVGVEDTEKYFVDSLEKWREVNGLEKMILCGHSLGGYLSVAYAERYPERVHTLVLASPVGVPIRPEGYMDRINSMSFLRRNMFKWVVSQWDKGTTPADAVRGFGPIGLWFMKNYAEKRFQGHIDKELFGQYLYHSIAVTSNSGDKALGQLLYPMAYAKQPLCYRIPKLPPSIPVHFVYGVSDWMDHRHAERLTPGEGQEMKLHLVEQAGHQLFLDNPREFNHLILSLCGLKVPREDCLIDPTPLDEPEAVALALGGPVVQVTDAAAAGVATATTTTTTPL